METWNLLTVGDPVFTVDGFMGARCWDGTVAALTGHNHRVFAPTLSDEHTSSLLGHIGQVCTLIREKDLHAVILVGHSYGGMVITGVAGAIPGRISRLVYLDAALPDPGESLFSLLEQGLSSSTSHPDLPDPSPPYVEILQFDPEIIRSIPKTYIFCTKSVFAEVTRNARKKIATDPRRWTLVFLPSSHIPMADMPEDLYRLLLDIAS